MSGLSAHFYRGRTDSRYVVHEAERRLRDLGDGVWGATIRIVGGAPYTKRDPWLVCVPEPSDDGFGRRGSIERKCGRSRFRVRRSA